MPTLTSQPAANHRLSRRSFLKIGGFGVAGLVSPSSFGYLVDRTGSWVVPFIGSMALLLAGAVLASRLKGSASR